MFASGVDGLQRRARLPAHPIAHTIRDVPSIAPWIAVADAQRAVEFYEAAFGATERYHAEDPDGVLQVARLTIGEAEFWVQTDDEAPARAGDGAIRMILTVDDPDAVFAQALAAGATEIAAVYEGHGWRIGRLADPFGHHWEVGRPLG
jgi:PhnB protein